MTGFDIGFYIIGFGLFIFWIINKIKSDRLRKKFDKAAPIVGMPNKDKVDILLALFAIRCQEISYLYSRIEERQKKAGKGNWVELFIEDELLVGSMRESVYGEVSEKRQLQNKEEAKKIVSDNFSYDHYIGSISNSDIIKLAFICYHNGIYNSDRLRGIMSYNIFEKTIQALIEEYDLFKDISSDSLIRPKFYNIFARNRALQVDENINKIWNMILLALKASLRMLESRKDNTFDTEKILTTIEALESLEWKLRATISERNYKDRYYDTQTEEKIIQDVWENSPFI